MILVQFGFPFAGPWGPEMTGAMGDLAADIADQAGLRWKIWTGAPEQGRAGGLYLFDGRAAPKPAATSTPRGWRPSELRTSVRCCSR